MYGDPRTHYSDMNSGIKSERTRALHRFTTENYSDIKVVCEFGCNNGRNLMAFYKNSKDVYGFDICNSSLENCRSTMSKYSDNFVNLDLFNDHAQLSKIKDNFFDLSFTMCFLMHLPSHENKKQLIKEIIRTSKIIIFFEHSYSDPVGEKWDKGNVEKINNNNFNFLYDYTNEQSGFFLSHEKYNTYDNRFVEANMPRFRSANNRSLSFWVLEKDEFLE